MLPEILLTPMPSKTLAERFIETGITDTQAKNILFHSPEFWKDGYVLIHRAGQWAAVVPPTCTLQQALVGLQELECRG